MNTRMCCRKTIFCEFFYFYWRANFSIFRHFSVTSVANIKILRKTPIKLASKFINVPLYNVRTFWMYVVHNLRTYVISCWHLLFHVMPLECSQINIERKKYSLNDEDDSQERKKKQMRKMLLSWRKIFIM